MTISVLAILVFAIVMAIALYRTNVNSPRINLTELADLKEVPEEVRNALDITLVSTVEEVLRELNIPIPPTLSVAV